MPSSDGSPTPHNPEHTDPSAMTPLREFPLAQRQNIGWVLTDIDDTLTHHGRLPAVAYAALERLQKAGLKVVPVTGRPAGWCDHIARMWPVDGVVGENGAFWFRYDAAQQRMIRRYWRDAEQRRADRKRLDTLCREILAQVPGAAVASDQAYREADLAIDFCEDVPPLPAEAVARIVALFEGAGARAKVSSIHVNGWFGDYDKLTMTACLFQEAFGLELDSVRERVVFAGDSPNDAPMFAAFPHGVGVSNVRAFADRMESLPRWITEGPGGTGFAELAAALLE